MQSVLAIIENLNDRITTNRVQFDLLQNLRDQIAQAHGLGDVVAAGSTLTIAMKNMVQDRITPEPVPPKAPTSYRKGMNGTSELMPQPRKIATTAVLLGNGRAPSPVRVKSEPGTGKTLRARVESWASAQAGPCTTVAGAAALKITTGQFVPALRTLIAAGSVKKLGRQDFEFIPAIPEGTPTSDALDARKKALGIDVPSAVETDSNL